jgi:hypothetical protein
MNGMEYTPQRGDGPLGGQAGCQADFTYSMRPDVIAITDLDLGNKSVTNDIGNVLRKIEYWHQGSIAGVQNHVPRFFRAMGRGALGQRTGFLFCPPRNRRSPSQEKTFKPGGQPPMKKSGSLLIGTRGFPKPPPRTLWSRSKPSARPAASAFSKRRPPVVDGTGPNCTGPWST